MYKRQQLIPVLFVTVGFGIIGFLDDFLKIIKKQSEGLKPYQKLILQLLVAGIFTYYCVTSPDIGTEIIIPFSGGKTWDMGWLFIPFCIVAILATDNGVNFTDGLDGLCSSAVSYTHLDVYKRQGIYIDIGSQSDFRYQ